ncbi:hypothetical protein O1611_g197 [Lasiodiplodia mahajangana]|uniref:Uncharacterized protein n=1 Tax=Lasiodiplodia mahajangana TaxID=1108764 RepID=A0ACC2K0Y7_9PEZI|nr:hypothetical protein O1611_g197 [Lasiodiplodia mahajangana]
MDIAVPVELESFVQTSSIVDEIWGPSPNPDVARTRFDTLASFLLHFEKEREFEQAHEDDVIATIRAFRQYPGKRKSELRSDSESASTRSSGSSDGPNFDLVVRCMFLTACSPPGSSTMGGHSIFRPRWKESESLERYLARVFPVTRAPQQDLASFRLGKLSASYLRSFAYIQIRWTDNLSDHLILLRGEGWKSLYLFRHPGFLKVSLDVLSDADEDAAQTPLEALKLGCLPPSLLKETLMTLDIIFPVIGDNASRSILEREVEKNGLDQYLLDRFYLDSRDHERPSDALDPSDVRSLYLKYPYWADRLYDLWREADDPTPTTRIERWTEARRNPRFAYWCTVVSILIAISFGIFATALGAVQVWISWCAWVDDPTVPQCGYKKSP